MFETTWPFSAYTSFIIIFFRVSGFKEDFVLVFIPVEEVKKWYYLSLSIALSLSLSLIIFADHIRFD